MTELRIGAPNEKQRRFLLDRHRHIAYGGARGGGKSWAVRTKAKLLALRYAGIKLLIVRRTLQRTANDCRKTNYPYQQALYQLLIANRHS